MEAHDFFKVLLGRQWTDADEFISAGGPHIPSQTTPP